MDFKVYQKEKLEMFFVQLPAFFFVWCYLPTECWCYGVSTNHFRPPSWEELGGREQVSSARESAGEVLGRFRIIAKVGYGMLRVSMLGTNKRALWMEGTTLAVENVLEYGDTWTAWCLLHDCWNSSASPFQIDHQVYSVVAMEFHSLGFPSIVSNESIFFWLKLFSTLLSSRILKMNEASFVHIIMPCRTLVSIAPFWSNRLSSIRGHLMKACNLASTLRVPDVVTQHSHDLPMNS